MIRDIDHIPECSSRPPPWRVTFERGVDMAVCLLVVLVNAFILCALWSRRRRHAARSHLFVLNLAACGLIGGLSAGFSLAISSSCDATLLFSRERALCEFQLVCFIFSYMINVTALGVVALDRYILIVHSLRYRAFMTRRRALWMIAISWAISSFGSLSVLISSDYENGKICSQQSALPAWHLLSVQVPMNALILLLITATHWRMRSEARRIHKQHMELMGEMAGHEWDKFSAKSARVVTLVVVCYLIAFVPVQAVLILDVLDVSTERNRRAAFFVCVPVFTMSYLINPLLYTYKNSHLRADLLTTWRNVVAVVKTILRCSTGPDMHSVRI